VADPSFRLSYAKEDVEREIPFSENLEAAAIACLAEAERRKTSRFLGGEGENLRILCKLHYPIWAIPWKDGCLLIDGMAVVSGNIIHYTLPDVENFVEQLRKSTKVEELFRSVLRSHSETFAKFTSQTQTSIEGFIDDNELLLDMTAFIEDGQKEADAFPANSERTTLARITRRKTAEIREKIKAHHDKLRSEINGLRFAMETLDAETKMHKGKLQQELKQIQERHRADISAIKERVERRSEELNNQLIEKIDKIDSIHKEEKRKRLDEKRRQEPELLRLEQNKSEYERRKEARKQKGDTVGTARWDVRLRNTQNQVSTVKKRIRTISNSIKKSEKATEKTKKEIEKNHKRTMAKERRKVADAENLWNSEVEKKTREMEELEQESRSIISKIEDLAQQKEEHSSEIRETAISWNRETTTLIRIPYYFVKYTVGKETRRIFRPPVRAQAHKGLVTKIRKALKSRSLKSRIDMLLKPRSKSLERLFVSLAKTAAKDARIRNHLDALGEPGNLLPSKAFKERIRKGLQELEAEGWIKPEEKLIMTKTYATD
jgi:myosin heavy subunit